MKKMKLTNQCKANNLLHNPWQEKICSKKISLKKVWNEKENNVLTMVASVLESVGILAKGIKPENSARIMHIL